MIAIIPATVQKIVIETPKLNLCNLVAKQQHKTKGVSALPITRMMVETVRYFMQVKQMTSS